MIGEPDDEAVAYYCEGAGDYAFDDEDPTPTADAVCAFHLHYAVGEDAGEGGGETADEVEDWLVLDVGEYKGVLKLT